MHVLDRIFDGDDVAVTVLVAVADHRGHRGRFAGAGATDEQYQTAFGHHHVLEYRRQVEVLELRDSGGDGAQDQAGATLLDEGIDAKAADAGGADGKVTFFGGLEFGGLLVIHHGAREFDGVLLGQGLSRYRRHLAIHLHGGREAGSNEEVGTLLLDHHRQQLVHELQCFVSFHDATPN